jgi:hypothetical protein
VPAGPLSGFACHPDNDQSKRSTLPGTVTTRSSAPAIHSTEPGPLLEGPLGLRRQPARRRRQPRRGVLSVPRRPGRRLAPAALRQVGRRRGRPAGRASDAAASGATGCILVGGRCYRPAPLPLDQYVTKCGGAVRTGGPTLKCSALELAARRQSPEYQPPKQPCRPAGGFAC